MTDIFANEQMADGLCVHYFLFLIKVNFDILEKTPLPQDYVIEHNTADVAEMDVTAI